MNPAPYGRLLMDGRHTGPQSNGRVFSEDAVHEDQPPPPPRRSVPPPQGGVTGHERRAAQQTALGPRRWEDSSLPTMTRGTAGAPEPLHEGVPVPQPREGTGVGAAWVPPPPDPSGKEFAKYYALFGPDAPLPLGGVWLATWGRLRSFDVRVFGRACTTEDQARACLKAHGHHGLAERLMRKAY